MIKSAIEGLLQYKSRIPSLPIAISFAVPWVQETWGGLGRDDRGAIGKSDPAGQSLNADLPAQEFFSQGSLWRLLLPRSSAPCAIRRFGISPGRLSRQIRLVLRVQIHAQGSIRVALMSSFIG